MSVAHRRASSAAADGVFCPRCGRRTDAILLAFNRQLEAHIVRALQTQTPQWKPAQGACPRCVLDAVTLTRQQRRAESMQNELQLPYPVYSRAERALLAMPYRMHAYPQFTGRGVVMAFLDSGFYPHPDLTKPYNRILTHVDATAREPVERPRFRRPALTSWHGLMTLSVAAGNGFLSEGKYRGIAYNARLVLIKTGNRRGRAIHETDIYRALTWALEQQHHFNIRVVNLSVGGDFPSDGTLTKLDDLVEEASARGMTVVCAVGNDNAERVMPPASAPSALTVGGLDDCNSWERGRFRLYPSNYGRGGQNVSKPDVIAPARWVPAPMLPQTWVYNEGQYLWKLLHASDDELEKLLQTRKAENTFKKETLALPLAEIRATLRARMIEQKYIHAHYQHADGTSMAAPLVSAVAAQMLEANPTLTPAQIKSILRETAHPLEQFPRAPQGCGVLNAAHAVARALRAPNGALANFPLSPQIHSDSIEFTYYDVKAQRVAAVGEWNGWRTHAHYLYERAPGVWHGVIPRPPRGRYAYKFLVERENQRLWRDDPENLDCIEDGLGGFYSWLNVKP